MDDTIMELKTRLAARKLVKALHIMEAFISCHDDELIGVAKDYVYDAKNIIEERTNG